MHTHIHKRTIIDLLYEYQEITKWVCGQLFSRRVWIIFLGACPLMFLSTSHFFVSLPASCWYLWNLCSNRVEAWTRDVQFLLRQEGRPVAQLVGNMSTVRIMTTDWKNTDKATQWIHQRAASSRQPFALYLGLNLPHTYKTESLGPTGGGSTFRTSPYWLTKACLFSPCFLNVFSPLLQNYIVCFYINH